jgi:3-oxoacyl-[acyl-carrier-protein] synthase III
MGSKVLAIGSSVPTKVLTNKDFERYLDTSDEWIVSRTGIRERRIAPEGVLVSDLATDAAKKALAAAGTTAEELDMIIIATATPDTPFPSTACWTQAKLGIKNIPCFDVVAGCSGFLYALITANGLIQGGAARKVLVIGAEELSRVTNYDDRNTCVLFGDGAGAVVLAPSDGDGRGIIATTWGADGSLGELLIQQAGGTRMQASHETVDKKLHTIQMAGNEVYRYAVKAMQAATLEVLEKSGISADDVDLFVPHQANYRIITATAERAGIPMEKVLVTIDRYGNSSAASIPVALADAVAEGRLKPGHLVLTAAFGAGFTWAAALIRW